MIVTPISPIHQAKNPPRQHRAQMSVRFDEHTVTDSWTGERFELSPEDAWKKFSELNGIVV